MTTETKSKKSAPVNARALAVAKARAAILKQTGQKPLQASNTTLPHVSTGSFPIDMLIGGTPTKDGKGSICPGIPRRRITEIYGPESSGKTTLLIHTMVQAQKAGGSAMFVDFENSLDHNYAKALGLSYDEDKLLVYQPNSMEEGFQMIYIGILTGFDVIGVDSVAAMVPKDELEKSFEDNAKIGAVARVMSRDLPKLVLWLQKYPVDELKKPRADHDGTSLIFVNQTRALINTGGYGGHGDNESTSGGKALKFYAYLRLRASKIKAEVIERVDPLTGKKRRFPYGNVTDVKVIKSKVNAKQGHSCQVFIRFGQGIDDYYSVIETAIVQKLARRDGAKYTIGDQSFLGKDKFRQFLVSNPKVFEALRSKLMQLVSSTGTTIATDEELSEDDVLLDAVTGDFEDTDDIAAAAEAATEEAVVEDSADTATASA